jgi:arylsulfatase A-like enzyme
MNAPSGTPHASPDQEHTGSGNPATAREHAQAAPGVEPSPPSFGSCIRAALAAALLGSTLLGICEHAAGSLLFPAGNESWPGDVVLAATGRIIITYLLFWIPILAVSSVLYWLFARRRRGAAPAPFFLGLFVALATLVVLPADLRLLQQFRMILVVPGILGGLALAVGIYALARTLHRRLGPPRFRWCFRAATGAAALVTIGTGLLFARSPLRDPGTYRVRENAPPSATPQRPSILWIVLDTARADRLGVYGCEASTTPFLDEWARQCLVFDRAVADGMWTAPAHASMFTGVPVRQHGVGGPTLWLEDSFRTAADALRENGYATALFSNNPLVGPDTNLSKGFDTQLIVWHFHRMARFSLEYLCQKWGLTPPLPWLDLDNGAALTNFLIPRWLDRHTGQPVFVFVNYMETHLPYRAPRRYRERFLSDAGVHRSYDLRRSVYGELEQWLTFDAVIDGYDDMPPFDRDVVKRQYDAAVRYLDDRVAELLGIFRRRGLLDGALVVITSDHGEYLDTHGMWSHHFLVHEDLIHVPLLIRAPGWTGGRRIASPVQLTDLYPTVLRAALGPRAAEPPPLTRDLAKFAAQADQQRVAISETFGAARPIAERLLAKPDWTFKHRATPQIAAADARLKYIRSRDGTRELYDLATDPGELNNLADARWQDVRRFDNYIEWWLRQVPEYQAQPRDAEPDRETLKLLKALGYVQDDD